MLGRILSAIPGVNLLWGALCVLLFMAIGYSHLGTIDAQRTSERLRATLAEERADRARERETLAAAALKASERARELESMWRTKHEEVQTHAQAQIRAASADAARARSAADSLQRRAEVIAAQCANPVRDTAAADPGFAARGPTAADPGAVLAELLGRLAQTAGELAAVADARGAAGVACQRAYEVLAPPKPP